MALEQERAALSSPDVPHDDAVVRSAGEEKSLHGVPPEAGDAS